MKKGVLFLFAIFLLASVSALSITLPENVNQGSTIIVTLQGNILNPIAKSDVGFFEGHVQIPLDYDIEKIEDTYYIYALVPYSEKLYTLKINDVYFKENNAFKTADLEANFSSSNLTADFNVNPGFIITRENSFQLDLYNNLNSNLDITYTLGNTEGSKTIPLQETSKLNIDTSKIKGTSLNHLIISSQNTQYDISVYVIRNQTFIQVEKNDSNNSIIEFLEGPNLQFSIDKIDETLKIGEGYEYPLVLENQGDEDSGEITLKVSDELIDFVSLEISSIENLPPNAKQEIKFSIFTKIPINLEGGILAESSKSSDELKIVLFAEENVEPVSSIKSKSLCKDLNGTICLLSQTCSGKSVPSSDNIFCCTNGVCQNPGNQTTGEGNNSNTVSIIIVVVALLIILGLIFWRLKKTRKKQITQSARLEPKKSSLKKDFDIPNFREG